MALLSNSAHALSDRELLDVYESILKTTWKKRLRYLSAQNIHRSVRFHSTVGISMRSTDAYLFVLARSTATFRSIQERQRKANKRGVSIDMINLLAKNDSRSTDTSQKPRSSYIFLYHITSCRNRSFEPLEEMEKLFSIDNEAVDQSTTGSIGDYVDKLVTDDTLKEDSNETFAEVMTKMTSQLVEQTNKKEDQYFLLQKLNSLSLDLKRRSRLIVERGSISNIQE